MSGHSKWATIKRKKGVKDAARGKIFTKLSRDILVAAQQGNPDPNTNFSLRLAIDRAKTANMPNDNINRVIQKASGELKGSKISEVAYEAYGAGGSMIIVDCKTDNTNRALTEVKALIHRLGGKMASEGSISWQFEHLGQIILEPKIARGQAAFGKEQEYDDINPDELALQILDYPGVVDIQTDEGEVHVFTEREALTSVRDKLMQEKMKVIEARLVKVSNAQIELSAEDQNNLENMINELEELEDVNEVWTNVLLA